MTRFSLVLATRGREREPAAFLRSLAAQRRSDAELVVVDQNPDGRLDGILQGYDAGPVQHLRCEPGLSRARNLGLEKGRGAILAFPDDDCCYPPGLLDGVDAYLRTHPEVDGLSVAARPPGGGPPTGGDGRVRLRNVFRRWGSFNVFVRRRVVESIGGFEPALGLGAPTPFQGGEDIDHGLRAVRAGFHLAYTHALHVEHPDPLREGYGAAAERAERYGAGIGRMWRLRGMPAPVVLRDLLRPLGGAGLALLSGRGERARYHLAGLRGRWRGYRTPDGA